MPVPRTRACHTAAALVLAGLVLALVPVQACVTTTHLTSCGDIATLVSNCANADTSKTFNAKLDCTVGGAFDCTGVSVELKGRLKLSAGRACSASARPKLSSAGYHAKPLLSMAGTGAFLSIKNVDFDLGKGRAGIRADGADSLVLSNVGISNAAAPDRGGALFVKNTPTKVTGSKLSNSSAPSGGGGLYATTDSAYTGSTPAVQLIRTEITQNRGAKGGGVWADNATLSIRGGDITYNEAKWGGGVYARVPRADASLTGLTISGYAQLQYNGAKAEGGGGGQGGGVYLEDTRTSVRSSYVRYNNAAGAGAGIYAVKTGKPNTVSNADKALLTLSAAWVRGNKADGRGAGVYLSDVRTWASDSSLKENIAGGDGGGLYAVATVPDADNYLRFSTTSLVEDNKAVNGGGLYVDGVRLVLGSSTLNNNVASGGGGGMYVTTDLTDPANPAVAITGSTLRNNLASTGNGGAAFILSTVPANNPPVKLTMSTTSLLNNNKAVHGGALYLQDVVSDVSSTTFRSNTATSSAGEGGAVYIALTAPFTYTASALNVGRTSFQSNTAGSTGGALYLRKDAPGASGVACSERCSFSDNTGVFSSGDTLMTKRLGAGLTINLAAATFTGSAQNAALCGAASASTSASSVSVSSTEMGDCDPPVAGCNDYCRRDLIDTA
ncbi:hypothetical protein Rsub_09809 [Raphidocelis subcapitata]|uniref:Right handed beta helix domain-containing protein n=1 Tax=Raphidocelis subcapitata TaxID=307507 RepID=A0A2V0PDH4_9CHLO|nr:hypothetical protein Rsub_09809 [Raphidocelis subcapitata]|eukprot:GBF97012.1 hypothetical protein Rsub_09809 [Raphidocelis subcapitata]